MTYLFGVSKESERTLFGVLFLQVAGIFLSSVFGGKETDVLEIGFICSDAALDHEHFLCNVVFSMISTKFQIHILWKGQDYSVCTPLLY